MLHPGGPILVQPLAGHLPSRDDPNEERIDVPTRLHGVLAQTLHEGRDLLRGETGAKPAIADLDSPTLTGGTVTISGNYAGGEDALAFTNQSGITGSWNSGTGVLTLSGSASLAAYQTALRSITYADTSDNPSTLTRTISFVVIDGTDPSSAATRGISVAAVNDPPAVTATGGTLAYTEGAGAIAIDSGLTIADLDSTTLTGGTAGIGSQILAQAFGLAQDRTSVL